MGKTHYAVVANQNGTVAKLRMKQWLRDNPQELPAGMDATDNTAWQLRQALRKKGWRLEILADEVRIIKPDAQGDTSFADAFPPGPPEDEEVLIEAEQAEEVTFGLERDLQQALRNNISQLEVGLTIIDGGAERIVDAGHIDITATDSNSQVVIIELKAGIAGPDVVAQILAYMGSVAETDKKPVRGIIVAGDFHKKVVLASHAVPNLELKKYSFQFKFGIP